jgi:hypothetical protein
MIVTNRPSVNRSRAATLSRDYLRHGDLPPTIPKTVTRMETSSYGVRGDGRQLEVPVVLPQEDMLPDE